MIQPMIQHIRTRPGPDAPSLCGEPYVEPKDERTPYCPDCIDKMVRPWSPGVTWWERLLGWMGVAR